MHITIIMVVTYILCCVWIGTAPWRYWQLNARYFCRERGIFSKLATDSLIPEQWRLLQRVDSEAVVPSSFPVFLKPEWGQNARGIHRIDDNEQLESVRIALSGSPQRYLMQHAAPGQREYEIFSIDSNKLDGRHDVLTITEATNTHERYPINSKYNRNTRYTDVTAQFAPDQLATVAGYLSQIGQFGICRMSVRADSHDELVAGHFHVIEINLFLPMPINLLDGSYSWRQKWRFIRASMISLAQATRMMVPLERPQPIFARMMLYGRSIGAAGTFLKEAVPDSGLSDSGLSHLGLSGSELSGSELSRSELSRSELSGSELSRSRLSRSGLSRITLPGLALPGFVQPGSEQPGRTDSGNATTATVKISEHSIQP